MYDTSMDDAYGYTTKLEPTGDVVCQRQDDGINFLTEHLHWLKEGSGAKHEKQVVFFERILLRREAKQ